MKVEVIRKCPAHHTWLIDGYNKADFFEDTSTAKALRGKTSAAQAQVM